MLQDVFAERGVEILAQARARVGARDGDGVVVTLADGRTVSGSHALMTVGSVPNTAELGAGEGRHRAPDGGGFIAVDRVSRTSVPGIYAAGDCTGVLMLASVAAMQGRIAMWHALGEGVAPIKLKTVAADVFTRPEIATVGISQRAIDAGEVPARTIMLPLVDEPAGQDAGPAPRVREAVLPPGHRAWCIGGVVVAPVASELILPIALAVQNGLTVDRPGAHVLGVPVAVGLDHRGGPAADAPRRPGLRVRSGASLIPRAATAPTIEGMSIVPTSSKVPVVPVAAGAIVAQLGAAAIGLLLPFPALLAIVLTAGAARVATRGRVGPVVARTGLAVGAASAVLGLVLSGLGLRGDHPRRDHRGGGRRGRGRGAPPPLVLDLADDRALRHGAARAGREPGDRAGLVRVERLLHLHRLEHDDQVALGDRVAVGHRDLDDRALHRAVSASPDAAALPGRRRARRGAAFSAAAPPADRAETGGQRDLEPLAADLDHDGLARLGSSSVAAAAVERRDGVVPLGLDPPGVHAERLGGERRVAHDQPVERQHGRHALDHHLVERAAGPLQRLARGSRR